MPVFSFQDGVRGTDVLRDRRRGELIGAGHWPRYAALLGRDEERYPDTFATAAEWEGLVGAIESGHTQVAEWVLREHPGWFVKPFVTAHAETRVARTIPSAYSRALAAAFRQREDWEWGVQHLLELGELEPDNLTRSLSVLVATALATSDDDSADSGGSSLARVRQAFDQVQWRQDVNSPGTFRPRRLTNFLCQCACGDKSCSVEALAFLYRRMPAKRGGPKWQRLQDTACAAAHRLPVLEWIARTEEKALPRLGDWSILRSAAHRGALDSLEWLQARGFSEWSGCADGAATGGHLRTLEWLLLQGAQCTNALEAAALAGHAGVCRFLIDHDTGGRLEHANRVLSKVAREGWYELLQLLLTRTDVSSFEASVVTEAARTGQLACVEFLHSLAPEQLAAAALDAAVGGGQQRTAQWIVDHSDVQASPRAMELAAQHGFLDTMRWLRTTQGTSCSAMAVERAIRGNHFSVLRYLYESDLPTLPPRIALRCAEPFDRPAIKTYLQELLTAASAAAGSSPSPST